MRATRIAVLLLVLGMTLLACGFSFGTQPTATPPPPAATVAPLPTNTTEAPPTVAPTSTTEPTQAPEATATEKAVVEPTATAESVVAKPTGAVAQGGIIKKSDAGQSNSASVFEFASHTAWVDDAGDINIVGEVVNISDQTIDTVVSVQAALTDENGDAVSGDFGAYVDRPVIPPGEKSSFWVLITSDSLGGVDAQSVADYELTLWVSEDPSPDVELTVDEADTIEENGYFYIRGLVTNQTDLTFDSLSIYSTLYDADGNVINATVDMPSLDQPLGPGEQTSFEGYFLDHFDNADSWYVFVTGWPTDAAATQERTPGGELRSGADIFEIDSHTGWVSDNGNVSIVGWATNVSEETIDGLVLVEATLKDADGTTIEGEFTAYLDRPKLAPGDWSSFWVLVTADQLGDIDPNSITDYEVALWITPEPSPDVEITVDSSEGGVDGGNYVINGTVTNQTDLEFTTLAVYSSLADADGNVINATVDLINLDTPLAPGDSTDFSGYFIDHFDGVDSYRVFVTGYTADAAGG